MTSCRQWYIFAISAFRRLSQEGHLGNLVRSYLKQAHRYAEGVTHIIRVNPKVKKKKTAVHSRQESSGRLLGKWVQCVPMLPVLTPRANQSMLYSILLVRTTEGFDRVSSIWCQLEEWRLQKTAAIKLPATVRFFSSPCTLHKVHFFLLLNTFHKYKIFCLPQCRKVSH